MGAKKEEDPLIGRLIAQRYRLISKLGEGGMALVYLARHVVIERLAAIKFLRPELGQVGTARTRFLREARAVNRVNHPNIVEILDYGESDGLVYLVMEYVPGQPLLERLARGPFPWPRAARLGLQIASALGRAHQMGVIHRDLKPANILLVDRRGGDDLAKLTDFGVAKLLSEHTLTETDVALGTPGYVAPEYLEYGAVDARSDLFSLGVVLYEATCGQRPFELATKPKDFEVPPPCLSALGKGVPRLFGEVVATLLQAEPDDRPRDGFEAMDLLQRALAEEPPAHRPTSSDARLRSTEIGLEPRVDEGQIRPRSPGPRLSTGPVEEVAMRCAAAWAHLEKAAQVNRPLPAEAEAGLSRAHEQVELVQRIAKLVERESREVEELGKSARRVRAKLGRRLDDVSRRRSKKLGWAGTIAEQRERVRATRDSGIVPAATMEAMMWEQAALEQEEDHVRNQVGSLTEEMREIQHELDQLGGQQDRALGVATAKLEGHIAALRAMALEAWMSMKDAARGADLSIDL